MKSLIAFTVAAALSGAALAQQQPRSAAPPESTAPPAGTGVQQAPASTARTQQLEAIFDQLNTSHTGKLTRAEAQAHPTVAANFDAADTNHDGVLTKEEFLAAFQPAQ